MSLVYYKDQLQTYWKQTPRPNVYLSDVKHYADCTCCYRVTDNGNGKRRKVRK